MDIEIVLPWQEGGWLPRESNVNRNFQLANSVCQYSEGLSGQLEYSYYGCKEFCVAYITASVSETIGFTLVLRAPMLLLCIPWKNAFPLGNKALGIQVLAEQQYNMYCTGSLTLHVDLEFKRDYQLLVIGLSAAFLSPFATHSPELSALLEKQTSNKPGILLPNVQFLSVSMKLCLHKLLHYDMTPELAPTYYSSIILELLTLLIARIDDQTAQPLINETELQQAAKVKEIIGQDFELVHSVEQLARLVGSNEARLQQVFKQLYGQTVGVYSRQARLDKGYALLEQTDYPLRVICMMVGYPDPSNFSAAFKKQFGFRPGAIQKRK